VKSGIDIVSANSDHKTFLTPGL